MLSRVFERKNLKIAAHKTHPFPIEKEGTAGLRIHLGPACEQVSFWPGWGFGLSQPQALLGSRGMNSGLGELPAPRGCPGSGEDQQLSLAATGFPPHSGDEFSWKSISWAKIKLKMSSGFSAIAKPGDVLLLVELGWSFRNLGFKGTLGKLLCVFSGMFPITAGKIMRCIVSGANQGNQVGFRQKGAKESKSESFFVLIFVLYSKIPYFSKEKLILEDV